MQDLSMLEPFSEHVNSFEEIIGSLKTSDSLEIETSSDLQSILALVHIEAACLDTDIAYHRRLTPPNKEGKVNSSAQLCIAPFEESSDSPFVDGNRYSLVPLMSSVAHGTSSKQRPGVLDVVAQAACIANMMAPNGKRVRRMRHLLIAGSWLRSSLDSGLDSTYTQLKEILRDEGTIRVVPITEIEDPDYSSLPEISSRMIKRLSKVWPEMNFEQRAMALSEMMLPTLRSDLSAARIEELGWQRMSPIGSSSDIASQLTRVEKEWRESDQSDIMFASTLADNIIMNGELF